ncbi:MAG: DUF6600 domain-containing protein [Rhodospirillales bacterium]
MSDATELDINQLDQSQFTAIVAAGRNLSQPAHPSGRPERDREHAARHRADHRHRPIRNRGDTATPTTVTVVTGSAHVTGSGVDLTVGPQQTATLSGAEQVTGVAGPLQTDAFLQAQTQRDRPPPAQTAQAAPPPQVRNMTGGSDLARYGNWQSTPDYGSVWYPNNVAADWAPYRAGHWAYVAPWGWTWIDDAPWGFAPFHYGRWVSYGGRWGWVAAAQDAPIGVYPVYAPALVSFVDVSGALLTGAAIGFGAGLLAGGGGIGWVPLGYREPYYPWYRTSPRYLQNVNRISVVNVNHITINNYRNVNINNFRNARGATVVPAGAMMRGQRLAGFARPLPPAVLARSRPVVGRLPVRPAALPVRPAAPGPAFRPNHPGRPGALPVRPPLRPASGPGHPGFPARPGGPGRPGLPPLRPAGSHTRPVIGPGQPGMRPGEGGAGTRQPQPRPTPGQPGMRPGEGGAGTQHPRPTPRASRDAAAPRRTRAPRGPTRTPGPPGRARSRTQPMRSIRPRARPHIRTRRRTRRPTPKNTADKTPAPAPSRGPPN